jgi:hypothetical protein
MDGRKLGSKICTENRQNSAGSKGLSNKLDMEDDTCQILGERYSLLFADPFYLVFYVW